MIDGEFLFTKGHFSRGDSLNPKNDEKRYQPKRKGIKKTKKKKKMQRGQKNRGEDKVTCSLLECKAIAFRKNLGERKGEKGGKRSGWEPGGGG